MTFVKLNHNINVYEWNTMFSFEFYKKCTLKNTSEIYTIVDYGLEPKRNHNNLYTSEFM